MCLFAIKRKETNECFRQQLIIISIEFVLPGRLQWPCGTSVTTSSFIVRSKSPEIAKGNVKQSEGSILTPQAFSASDSVQLNYWFHILCRLHAHIRVILSSFMQPAVSSSGCDTVIRFLHTHRRESWRLLRLWGPWLRSVLACGQFDWSEAGKLMCDSVWLNHVI